MTEDTDKTLECKVNNITGKKKMIGGLISAGYGMTLGVATRLTCGKNAYALCGGALLAGWLISSNRKGKPTEYLINIASSEGCYYAGVFATEYALNLMK